MMRGGLLNIVIILLLVSACDTPNNTPDPQDKYFLRYYGQAGYQEAVDMVVDNDDGFILLGRTSATEDGPAQVYLVKTDKHGFVKWESFFGENEVAKDIELSPNGYLILSDSVDINNTSNILVRVLDQDGELIQKSSSFSFPGNFNEVGSTVTQVYDNAGNPDGFIATGYTDAPGDGMVSFNGGTTAIFVRFDQVGSIDPDWNNNAGASGNDYGVRVVQQFGSSSPPFLFFGYFNSEPQTPVNPISFNYWFSEMTANGGGVGTEIVPGSPTSDEKLTNVTPLNMSGNVFWLSGSTFDGTSDKIFISGYNGGFTRTLDEINLGNLGSLNESFRNVSFMPSARSGFLIAANQVLIDDSDIVVTKLNSDGSYAWVEPVRFGGNGNDRQASILELSSGRIMVFGTMEIGADRQAKMALMKLNSRGQLQE